MQPKAMRRVRERFIRKPPAIPQPGVYGSRTKVEDHCIDMIQVFPDCGGGVERVAGNATAGYE